MGKNKNIFKCSLCAHGKYTLIYNNVDGFKIIRCEKCGLVSTYPTPSRSVLEKMYSTQVLSVSGSEEDIAQRYLANPSIVEKLGYEKRLDSLKKYLKGKKVLELGCGAGIFLHYLKKHGFSVVGTEISPWGYEFAQKKFSLEVHKKELNQINFPKESFDGVLMYDVLEHTADPMLYIQESYRILKPDGLLVVNLPNFSSFMSKFRRDKWLKLIPPQHLYHFEKKTISRFLKKNNFQISEIKTNFGSVEELGKQLFLHLAKPEQKASKFSLASIYYKHKKLLSPIKLTTYKIINLSFSILGPVFNRLLVFFDHGEGIEVYAIKK